MSGLYERRLLRVERGFGVLEKLWAMPWIFILMLCALAGVGYVALYSAGGGNPAIYASKHAIRFAFGLILMVCIALVDIRVIAKLSWLGYAFGLGLLEGGLDRVPGFAAT